LFLTAIHHICNIRTYYVSPVPGCRHGETTHPVPGRELVENACGSVQPANFFWGLQRGPEPPVGLGQQRRQRAPVHHAEASPLGRRREQQVIPALPRVPERGAGERRLRLAGQHDVPELGAPLHQHEPEEVSRRSSIDGFSKWKAVSFVLGTVGEPPRLGSLLVAAETNRQMDVRSCSKILTSLEERCLEP